MKTGRISGDVTVQSNYMESDYLPAYDFREIDE
jgi:hypothetical protein